MYLKNERGMTLIELLASVALVSIILVYIFNFISSSYSLVGEEFSKNEEQTKINTFSSILLEDLKYAREIKVNDAVNNEQLLEFTNNEGIKFEFLFKKDEALYMRSPLYSDYEKLFEIRSIETYDSVSIDDGDVSFKFNIDTFDVLIDYKILTVKEAES